jgi:hypothetical protein
MKFKELNMNEATKNLQHVLDFLNVVDESAQKGNPYSQIFSDEIKDLIGKSVKHVGLIYAGFKQLIDTINKA